MDYCVKVQNKKMCMYICISTGWSSEFYFNRQFHRCGESRQYDYRIHYQGTTLLKEAKPLASGEYFYLLCEGWRGWWSELSKKLKMKIRKQITLTAGAQDHWLEYFELYRDNHEEGFPDSSVGKESTCNAGDPSSIPASGRCTREGIGYPVQYSWASLVAQLIKNLPEIQEIWV